MNGKYVHLKTITKHINMLNKNIYMNQDVQYNSRALSVGMRFSKG
jgi:hypothetical protein